MGTRSVSTGTVACRTTFSATLPIRKCASPVRPDVAMTMLSARRRASMMRWEASPISTCTVTGGAVASHRLGDQPLEVAALLGDQISRRRHAERDVGGQVERHDDVQHGQLPPVLLGEPCRGLECGGGLGREVVGDEDVAEEAAWHRCSFLGSFDPEASSRPHGGTRHVTAGILGAWNFVAMQFQPPQMPGRRSIVRHQLRRDLAARPARVSRRGRAGECALGRRPQDSRMPCAAEVREATILAMAGPGARIDPLARVMLRTV